jgi:hypothetical protein
MHNLAMPARSIEIQDNESLLSACKNINSGFVHIGLRLNVMVSESQNNLWSQVSNFVANFNAFIKIIAVT